jgi:hypothetical protein
MTTIPSGTGLSPRLRVQIALAVAQWLECATVTARAYAAGEQLRIEREELERNRRASSSDPGTKTILRLAVTIVISSGRIDATDRGWIERHALGEVELREIIAEVTRTMFDCYAAGVLQVKPQVAPIEMRIGDY